MLGQLYTKLVNRYVAAIINWYVISEDQLTYKPIVHFVDVIQKSSIVHDNMNTVAKTYAAKQICLDASSNCTRTKQKQFKQKQKSQDA
jgi:hypothetical protein